MRLTYDTVGNGHVISAISYPDVATVDFPDLPGGPTVATLVAQINANPGRFRVTGTPGNRQLVDNGVVLASEVESTEIPGGLASGGPTFASLYVTGQLREGAGAGITAFNGGGQGSAAALPNMFNRVTTSVATAPPFDSVALPASATGLDIVVVNATANPIQVFGNGSDTINGVAAATGITQPPTSVETYFCTVAGSWNVDPGIGFSGQLFCELSQDNITAFNGGGQGSATQLWAQTSRVTTAVATSAPYDSVKLPASAPGLELLVINHSSQSIQVFGQGSDTIDDVAAATGVTQMVNSFVIYSAAAGGRWYSNGIGTGFSGQFPTVSFMNGIAAFAGGGQASATLLATVINRVVTVGTAGDSVKLPVSAGGLQITVSNAHATNSLNVFPNSGDAINALAANAAFAIAAGKTAQFSCAASGQWHAVLSA